jgi:hypothetical protein
MNKKVIFKWLLLHLAFLLITILLLPLFLRRYVESYQSFFDKFNAIVVTAINFLIFIICLFLIFRVTKIFYEKLSYLDLNIGLSSLFLVARSLIYFIIAVWAVLTLPLSVFLLLGKILEAIVYF